jgi:hypothetical protein
MSGGRGGGGEGRDDGSEPPAKRVKTEGEAGGLSNSSKHVEAVVLSECKKHQQWLAPPVTPLPTTSNLVPCSWDLSTHALVHAITLYTNLLLALETCCVLCLCYFVCLYAPIARLALDLREMHAASNWALGADLVRAIWRRACQTKGMKRRQSS